MGTVSPGNAIPPFPLARLAGIGLIIFLANSAILVLQLLANPLLAPFMGSSLETWTTVIGVFLAGIALGNGFGGKLADRYPTPRTLAVLLLIGALAAVWVAIFPQLLTAMNVHRSIPLNTRIPLLATILCLPAGLVLSLLTPLAIKLGLPDVSRTGRVAGTIFALSTLGCLVGNYAAGFVLIPMYTLNTLVYAAAGSLAVLGIGTFLFLGNRATILSVADSQPVASSQSSEQSAYKQSGSPVENDDSTENPYAFTDIRLAFAIVFLASFSGMTLELTASRVVAQYVGVSLFTWTGVIGVMLAGTALGNLVGGVVADRVNRPGGSRNPRFVLAGSFLVVGAVTIFQQFAVQMLLTQYQPFIEFDPIAQVIGWTFSLFFVPMFVLGTISPQVIRLSVPDISHVGQVAGRVYAWSTVGAIVGTFATGYFLISLLGMKYTIMLVASIVSLTSLLVARVWDNSPLLYIFSIVLGGVTGGVLLNVLTVSRDEDLIASLETNYYTIKVTKNYERDEATGNYIYRGRWNLTLDHLIHSCIDPKDPSYLYYTHEHMQIDFLRNAREHDSTPRVLVVGGGGYTFPRYAMEIMPETRMDVVEIDPGVTWIARNKLGLKSYPGLDIHHMDGRQFVSEKVAAGTYDLVIQDAVNDLSVPAHLLTKEYNDAVKATLKPNGVYLLTVIDSIGHGKIWKAAMNTLRETYPPENIALLTSETADPSRCMLSKDEFRALKFYNTPETVMEKLEVLRDQEFSLPEFKAEIALVLSPAELAEHRDRIIEVSTYLFTRFVYVIYASDKPLDLAALRSAVVNQTEASLPALMATVGGFVALKETPPSAVYTHRVSQAYIQPFLDAPPRVILRDQYAPVDNLMADEFRYRYKKRPKKQE